MAKLLNTLPLIYMSLNKNSTHCVMPRSWSLATHVKEVDQSGRVLYSYSKSISKLLTYFNVLRFEVFFAGKDPVLRY